MHRVFVYGTLKQGERNHHYLSSAHYVGGAITREATYLMRQFASVSSPGKVTPGVFKEGSCHIAGEIYEVDDETLACLDELEGVGIKYTRESIEMMDGTAAFIYLEIPEKRQALLNADCVFVHEQHPNTCVWRGRELSR